MVDKRTITILIIMILMASVSMAEEVRYRFTFPLFSSYKIVATIPLSQIKPDYAGVLFFLQHQPQVTGSKRPAPGAWMIMLNETGDIVNHQSFADAELDPPELRDLDGDGVEEVIFVTRHRGQGTEYARLQIFTLVSGRLREMPFYDEQGRECELLRSWRTGGWMFVQDDELSRWDILAWQTRSEPEGLQTRYYSFILNGDGYWGRILRQIDGRLEHATPLDPTAFVNLQHGPADIDLEAYVSRWNTAINAKNQALLSSFYAAQVDYYGRRAARVALLTEQQQAFRQTPYYHQEIRGKIIVRQDGENRYKCYFNRRLLTGEHILSYLVFARSGNGVFIIAESDLPTDEKMDRLSAEDDLIFVRYFPAYR